MSRMIRKQIYIDDEQDRLLKRFVGVTGRSEADLIRESIVSHLIGLTQTSERLAAWERMVQRMHAVATRDVSRWSKTARPTTRGWTRDELYDE